MTNSSLVLRGELDVATRAQLDPVIVRLVDRRDHGRREEVSLDAAELHFIDACGLNALVSLHLALQTAGSILRTIRASHQLQRLVEICGLDEILGVRPAVPRQRDAETEPTALAPDVLAPVVLVPDVLVPAVLALGVSSTGRDRITVETSAKASVVFGSLAAQCVKGVCDSVVVDVVDGEESYRVVRPRGRADSADPTTSDPTMSVHTVQVSLAARSDPNDAGPAGNEPQLEGVATFGWRDREPTAADRMVVTALVDQALRTLAWQRSEERLRAVTTQAENLQLALASNRRIGTAIGILMALHKISSEQAFDLLRAASQRTHHKLHDLALDVIDTGWLDPALVAAPGLGGPSRQSRDPGRPNRSGGAT